ncbi:MAG: 2-hydroxyacid dehydrogenase [Mycobacterium leprae]
MAKPRVYVTRKIPGPALDILATVCEVRLWESETEPCPRAVLLQEAAAADGLLTMLADRVDAELLQAAPGCKVVSNLAVGIDNVDLQAATRGRVAICNTPGVLTETTADLAWALMFAAGRRIVEGQKEIETGRWGSWSPMYMAGQDIYGATLGVIGAGRIGSAVLRRGKGFNMKLLYNSRNRKPDLEQETGAGYRSLDALLSESDFIVVLCPLTPETRGLIGAREFALMKPTAVFVNIARGPVVDEQAMVEALRSRRPWAAGLDVFAKEPIGPDHPLLTLPNVVCVPHIGSASVATRTAMAVMAARNLVAVLTGEAAPSCVNPEVLRA